MGSIGRRSNQASDTEMRLIRESTISDHVLSRKPLAFPRSLPRNCSCDAEQSVRIQMPT
jgi:hypothetical protein